jgi:2'-5' RNA ligase
VRAEGIHVTLKFLGATPAAALPEITSALDATLAGMQPFGLQPEGVSSFGGRRNLRVVWVGVSGDTAALAALAGRVEHALAPLGFPTEQRPFAAHLTLGRIREGTPPAERERIGDVLAGFRPPPLPAFRAERVSLMQSVLGRGGASYRALAVFPLQ